MKTLEMHETRHGTTLVILEESNHQRDTFSCTTGLLLVELPSHHVPVISKCRSSGELAQQLGTLHIISSERVDARARHGKSTYAVSMRLLQMVAKLRLH